MILCVCFRIMILCACLCAMVLYTCLCIKVLRSILIKALGEIRCICLHIAGRTCAAFLYLFRVNFHTAEWTELTVIRNLIPTIWTKHTLTPSCKVTL